MQRFQHFACLKIKMFQQPIVNRFHIYLLLFIVLIKTGFLEFAILHIRNTYEWYGGSKDELGVETMTLEVGFLGKHFALFTVFLFCVCVKQWVPSVILGFGADVLLQRATWMCPFAWTKEFERMKVFGRKGMVTRCYTASVWFTLSYLIAIVLRVSRVDGMCMLAVLLKSRRILSLSDVFTFQRIAVAKWCGGSWAWRNIFAIIYWKMLMAKHHCLRSMGSLLRLCHVQSLHKASCRYITSQVLW